MSYGTYGHQVDRWRVMVENLEPLLESVPHASDDREELARLADEVRRLTEEIQIAKANLLDVTTRRRRAAQAARKKRLVIAARLQGHFGFEHPALLQFGIEPRAPRKRRKKKETGEEAGRKE
ncbi:MAG TPA: hypothetical protein VN851_19165 [Thermoanaerobaculia bacterium]|nr:hypothetical protein [Thermoanaerobaculia bacterium]